MVHLNKRYGPRRSGRWVTISAIARQLGCSRATVTNRLRDHTIPGATVFLGRIRVERKTYVQWAREQGL